MTSRRLHTLLILILSMSFISYAQFAEDVLRFSSFNTVIGSRTHALGGTAIGMSNDFSSLYSNPANLAVMKDFEFSFGMLSTSHNIKANYQSVQTSATLSATNVNNIGLVYPIPTERGSLTFAFGYGRIADFNSTVDFIGFNASNSLSQSLISDLNLNSLNAADRANVLANSIPFQIYLADTANGRMFSVVTDSVRQTVNVVEEGGLQNWSLGGAVDIAKNISLGVGLNIITGRYSYIRNFKEDDERNVYSLAPPFDFHSWTYESTIASDIGGFNMLFGLTYRIPGMLRLGVTYKTPTLIKVTEDFSDLGSSHFDNGDKFKLLLEGRTEYEIQSPPMTGAGFMVQLFDGFSLGGDLQLIDWTQMSFTTNDPALRAENRYIRNAFRSTLSYSIGAELYLIDLGLFFRGGFSYKPSPYKGDPTDFDVSQLALGAGIEIAHNTVLSGSFQNLSSKSFRDNYFINYLSASRTEESRSTSSVLISLTYRF